MKEGTLWTDVTVWIGNGGWVFGLSGLTKCLWWQIEAARDTLSYGERKLEAKHLWSEITA